MTPHLSLFVYESYRKLKAIDPPLPSVFSSEAEAVVARSRHSLKLFEDTKRGIGGQLSYFRDEVSPAHAKAFLNNTWLPVARFLETDLGFYSYDGKVITTTHAATFHLGVEPDALFQEGAGLHLQAIFQEYGSYLADLGASFEPGRATFVSSLVPQRFDEWPNGVRSAKYYGRVFNGKATPDINRLLTVFRGMMNFVDSVITAGMPADEIEYTVFKIRFLTLHQVLGSLYMLRDERSSDLTVQSMRFVKKITDSPEAVLIMSLAAKPFRNTLMHYNLDSRVDTARVDVAQPLFGLVPIYFPSHDVTSLSEVVDGCIEATAATLEEWATYY
ncbi:hypothetical protein [Streptomyces sp. 184]|uniref:hypothetical protein n=1 Tax=Streptomyces sp. 184 TaxID=1827526 RepID=UPI0038929230